MIRYQTPPHSTQHIAYACINICTRLQSFCSMIFKHMDLQMGYFVSYTHLLSIDTERISMCTWIWWSTGLNVCIPYLWSMMLSVPMHNKLPYGTLFACMFLLQKLISVFLLLCGICKPRFTVWQINCYFILQVENQLTLHIEKEQQKQKQQQQQHPTTTKTKKKNRLKKKRKIKYHENCFGSQMW